jgi:hypothetical protein
MRRWGKNVPIGLNISSQALSDDSGYKVVDRPREKESSFLIFSYPIAFATLFNVNHNAMTRQKENCLSYHYPAIIS